MKTIACMAAFGWLASLATAQSAKCTPVEGEYILAGEFAAAVPAFSTVAPETPLALAPRPSVRRVFRPYEVEALARKYSIAIENAEEVCFEHPMQALDRDRVLQAMQETLANPEAHVEIVELSQFPVPHGTLVFRKEALGLPASPTSHSPVTWRGDVMLADNHRFSVWARVVVTAPVHYVVAAAPIKRGEPITAAQLREVTADRFPVTTSLAASAEQVAGLLSMRDLEAGAEIHLNQLTVPPDVVRGDMVEIEVRSGLARLALTGKAETSGRTGDLITVRNPSSNRLFQARVSGKGRALLDAGGPVLSSQRN